MFEAVFYAFLSLVIISLISLVGILAFSVKHIKEYLLYGVSFSAGALLGDAFLHLLPEGAGSGFSLSVLHHLPFKAPTHPGSR